MSRLLNRKSITVMVILALTCIVCLPIVSPIQTASAQETTHYYNRQFSWDYGGNHWNWNLSIPASLYAAYKAVPQPVRARLGPEDFGFFTTTRDQYIQILAQKLNQTATQLGYGTYDQVNFVLAFVQSIPYKTDNESTPYQTYPRFPVEFLVDYVGDCKSHSTLFATLTLAMGFGTIYINPPDHLAVGVLGNNLEGAYWTYSNKTYYYCETTGSGFRIGQLPEQFIGQSANLFPINENIQYYPNFNAIINIDPNPTIRPYLPQPTPSATPEPTVTASPSVSAPTVQPVMPMSLNLISKAPIFFALIVITIVVCIFLTIRSGKLPSGQDSTSEPSAPETPPATLQEPSVDESKFCIFCGTKNKAYAVFCEKCGKQIG